VVVEKEEKHYNEKAEDELVSSEYELLRADLPNELEGLSVPRCRDGLH
jgi:hypothetical protein